MRTKKSQILKIPLPPIKKSRPFDEEQLLVDVVHSKKALNRRVSWIGHVSDGEVTHCNTGEVDRINPGRSSDQSADSLKMAV